MIVGVAALTGSALLQSATKKPEQPEAPWVNPQTQALRLRYQDICAQTGGRALGVVIDDSQGEIVVQRVIPGSAAERAGLHSGDVLHLQDDDSTVMTSDQFTTIVQQSDQVRVRVTRDLLFHSPRITKAQP